MKQVPLILWKDVRQFWPQLSLYAVLLVAFAWAAPQTWPGGVSSSVLGFFVTLLKILLGLCQFVLITSVVHADGLVGEEQFWITRPYDWRSLLGAKLLFVLGCVAFPLILMQWSLLHVAGLDPFRAKAALASAFLRFALGAWLPMMVIASVTESIAAAFSFLAALLVVWAATLQFILSGTESRMSPPDEFALFGSLFGIMLLAIVAYQFARRRTAVSRVAIVVTLGLFLLFIFGLDRQGLGTPVKKLIESEYETSPAGPLKLTFGPGPVPYDEQVSDLQYLRQLVEVKLPIRLEGLPSEARIKGPNVAVSLEADGIRYEGTWQNASVSEHAIGFPLPKTTFDRIAGADITLHLELIADQMTPARVKHVLVAERFPGPMDGNCGLINGNVSCRFAYEAWTPTHVQSPSGCGGQGTQDGGAWLLQVPPGGRPDPVVNELLPLKGRVCLGEPLTFTEYGSRRRIHLSLELPGLRLKDYRVRN